MKMDAETIRAQIERMDPDSEDYKNLLAWMLNQRGSKQPSGNRLTEAMMRLWPTPAFEAAIFNMDWHNPQIYLRKRGLNEVYPGQWHIPGKLYRCGEQDRDVANRLREEIGTDIETFVSWGRHITNEARGTVHSHLFMVRSLAGPPRIDEGHRWFPIEQLPSSLVDVHRDVIIPAAIDAYLSQRFLA